LASPSSLIRPFYPDWAAYPRLVIAWYIAALPAVSPISCNNSRRLGPMGGTDWDDISDLTIR
jgi:hypothetical protein